MMPSSFNWEHFLFFAKEIQANANSNEAALRSAVSRAYYATFLIARDIAEAKGQPIKHTYDDHSIVINYFSNGKFSGIGEKLTWLRKRRNECDYDADCRNFKAMVGDVIRKADIAISNLRSIKI